MIKTVMLHTYISFKIYLYVIKTYDYTRITISLVFGNGELGEGGYLRPMAPYVTT